MGCRYGAGQHDTAAAQVQLIILIIAFTETKKHSPNTVARAKHIHVCVWVCVYSNCERFWSEAMGRRYGASQHDTASAQVHG